MSIIVKKEDCLIFIGCIECFLYACVHYILRLCAGIRGGGDGEFCCRLGGGFMGLGRGELDGFRVWFLIFA